MKTLYAFVCTVLLAIGPAGADNLRIPAIKSPPNSPQGVLRPVRGESMEAVLAPNTTLLEQTRQRLGERIDGLEYRLSDWHERIAAGALDETGAQQFYAIEAAWKRYRDALSRTHAYMDQGIRVAAFIRQPGMSLLDSYKAPFPG